MKATDDELAMKTNALVSKARRNLILQAVPGWLIEEAIDQVRETARTKDAQDPDAAKRKLFDAFATVGVSAPQLAEYLGHGNALSPAELEDLRGYFSGIKEGYTTWAAIIAAKDEHKDDDGTAAAIAAAFEFLELPVAQVRKIKAKHIGKDADLLKWLTGEVAKKQNNGGKQDEPKHPEGGTFAHLNKKEEPANPTGQAEAQQQSGPASSSKTTNSSTKEATRQSQGNHSSETAQTSENEDAEPLNGKQGSSKPDGGNFGTGTGPAPTKQTQTSRPAPLPVSDDDDF